MTRSTAADLMSPACFKLSTSPFNVELEQRHAIFRLAIDVLVMVVQEWHERRSQGPLRQYVTDFDKLTIDTWTDGSWRGMISVILQTKFHERVGPPNQKLNPRS